MTQRGPLRLLPAPEDREPIDTTAKPASAGASTGRRLAPGAPESPGTVPLELAMELRTGEPVVWWNTKPSIRWAPVLWTVLAGLALLGIGSAFAPELWREPIAELWKLLVPAFAPAVLLTLREWVSCRDVMVTDNSIVTIDHRGRKDRLAFRNVRRVRRDLWTGGILLEGAAHKLRIPPLLAEDARAAIATQTRHMIKTDDGPDDPLGWLPR